VHKHPDRRLSTETIVPGDSPRQTLVRLDIEHDHGLAGDAEQHDHAIPIWVEVDGVMSSSCASWTPDEHSCPSPCPNDKREGVSLAFVLVRAVVPTGFEPVSPP
jgi:hypothetical protein